MAPLSNITWKRCIWWTWWHCEAFGNKSQLTKAIWRTNYHTISAVLVGIFEYPKVSSLINSSVEEYESEKQSLETRFENSGTIPSTCSLHCFIPQSRDTLLTKRFSTSHSSQVQKVSKSLTVLEMEEVTGYVTCNYGSQWWVAQVLEKDSENGELKVSLLSPNGPSRWYNYPST